MHHLLDRDAFRESVFRRDNYSCVVCSQPAVDAHHILERRLWPDGGYYSENGASLCGEHHIAAEMTILSCDRIREACGILKVILPPHLYEDQQYDKWGNPILPNGQRLRGELFHDESVQKILNQGRVLGEFTHYVKYPRTYHLPWSLGRTNDDRGLEDLSHFQKQEVVVTLKMDGEQTTMYRDHIHARSLDSMAHPSRTWVKNLHGQIAHELPEAWRLCGENLFAKHSIQYSSLPAYFLVFSLWDDRNVCRSWDETVEWTELLGLKTVQVLYRGPWDEKLIRSLHKDKRETDECEGYVVRLAGSFHYKDFRQSVGKFVRESHVHTHGHWIRNAMILNQVSKK
mgnify:CR=1 FL=1